MLHTFWIR